MHDYLTKHHADTTDEYRWGAVKFSADLSILTRFQRIRRGHSFADELVFYGSGATVEEVCDGTGTLERAQAIMNGLPASISSGLL
jgi:hypothetical protein